MQEAFPPMAISAVKFGLSDRHGLLCSPRDDNVGLRHDAGCQHRELSLRATPKVWRGNLKIGHACIQPSAWLTWARSPRCRVTRRSTSRWPRRRRGC